MFERKIVNADYGRTRAKRRRSELHVQYVNRMFSQFGAESQGNPDYRRVWKSCVNFEIGPALVKTSVGCGSCNVECVIVNAVDLC